MRFVIVALILLAVCAWAETKYVCKYMRKLYPHKAACTEECQIVYYYGCLKECKKLAGARAQDSYMGYGHDYGYGYAQKQEDNDYSGYGYGYGYAQKQDNNDYSGYGYGYAQKEDEGDYYGYGYAQKQAQGYGDSYYGYAQDAHTPKTTCKSYCTAKAATKVCHKI